MLWSGVAVSVPDWGCRWSRQAPSHPPHCRTTADPRVPGVKGCERRGVKRGLCREGCGGRGVDGKMRIEECVWRGVSGVGLHSVYTKTHPIRSTTLFTILLLFYLRFYFIIYLSACSLRWASYSACITCCASFDSSSRAAVALSSRRVLEKSTWEESSNQVAACVCWVWDCG